MKTKPIIVGFVGIGLAGITIKAIMNMVNVDITGPSWGILFVGILISLTVIAFWEFFGNISKSRGIKK